MGGILSSDTEHSHEVTFARSLIVPVYRNEGNIPALIEALEMLNLRSPAPIEVVFVIDGAPDRSGEVLAARRGEFHFAYQIVFHSRNFGSFTAIRTGMEHARGRLIAVMAADLQEPPELVLEFFARLDAGDVDIVFGERTGRNDAWLRDKLSNMFWWLYRKLVIRDIPKGGVDIFACNQMVAQTVLQICEPNSSLIAQLFWVGFRRAFVPYRRRERQIGESGWSFSRRMRYMMDSIFSFSDMPILLVLWFGIAGCALSLAFGAAIAAARLLGFIQAPGYTALAVLITFSTSALLAVQGIIGSYLWRTFENTKRRPLRIISGILAEPARTSAQRNA